MTTAQTSLVGRGAIPVARDYILIGGDRSPGVVTVDSCDSPRGWDIRKGYALSGATVVPTGDELSTVELTFGFWTADQITAWQAFAAKYFDKAVRLIPGSLTPKALSIQHPVINGAPLRVTEVVVKDCSALQNDGTGFWTARVVLLQYRKPQPALAKPPAAIPAAQQPKPTAQDAQDREIQQLLVEHQAAADAAAKSLGGQ